MNLKLRTFTIGLLRSDAHEATPEYVPVEADARNTNPDGQVIIDGYAWEHVSEDKAGRWLYRPIGSWL